ncbi:mannose-6-phosphate isomerase, class I [Desulfonema magnum]|uniref:Mannose-6-phosphate isomerase n=1 Tax=Desulfonema magnum TaxID=45655 RepID=A0A975GP84_9BACT|nr:mannose-6-phosphate isomerase, class I [Desulfonema magnum]QTA88530.1 Mannose-6-phosphate isomerase [Desulfonema magnum]
MKRISVLKNTVQEYAWGSHTAMSELLGKKPPSDNPQAELWMGAHPKAPSRVKSGGKWISLSALIEKNPEDILGKAVAEKFNNKLPYLFKVLAAAKPLSIQAHPNQKQARQGFERENRLNIPLDAANRNYKDDNHKPECICALTPFWALNGFRKISDMLPLMERICPKRLENEVDDLLKQPDRRGLTRFFHGLMTMDLHRQKEVIANAVVNAHKYAEDDPVFKWIIKLHSVYLSDIGVLSPIFLNLICLDPGQAMFLPAGELHAYLDGVGIELMANSDNVLRGGLTPKHVDLTELLRVLNFQERDLNILTPQKISKYESVYSGKADEFVLSVVSVKKNMTNATFATKSVEMLLCTKGTARIIPADKKYTVKVNKGTSVIIPAAVEKYRIEGNAVFYKASVPLISPY